MYVIDIKNWNIYDRCTTPVLFVTGNQLHPAPSFSQSHLFYLDTLEPIGNMSYTLSIRYLASQ